MTRKIIYYSLLLIGSLFVFRDLLYTGLLKNKDGYYKKYRTILMDSNSYEVLFLGSSRAEMHYNTKLIDHLTGWNSFNLGTAAATPMLDFCLLKLYLRKSTNPKMIFLEIDLNLLSENHSELYRFNNFFPFLQDPVIRFELSKIEPRMNHFFYNPFYSLPFSGLKNISSSIRGWGYRQNSGNDPYYKGFLSDTINTYMNYKPIESRYVHLSQHNKRFLDSLVLLCKTKSISLTFLTSPMYSGGCLQMINKRQVVSELEHFAKANRIHYYDFSSLPFCNKRELFMDPIHLNAKGAQFFSHYFVDYFNTKTKGNALN